MTVLVGRVFADGRFIRGIDHVRITAGRVILFAGVHNALVVAGSVTAGIADRVIGFLLGNGRSDWRFAFDHNLFVLGGLPRILVDQQAVIDNRIAYFIIARQLIHRCFVVGRFQRVIDADVVTGSVV